MEIIFGAKKIFGAAATCLLLASLSCCCICSSTSCIESSLCLTADDKLWLRTRELYKILFNTQKSSDPRIVASEFRFNPEIVGCIFFYWNWKNHPPENYLMRHIRLWTISYHNFWRPYSLFRGLLKNTAHMVFHDFLKNHPTQILFVETY